MKKFMKLLSIVVAMGLVFSSVGCGKITFPFFVVEENTEDENIIESDDRDEVTTDSDDAGGSTDKDDSKDDSEMEEPTEESTEEPTKITVIIKPDGDTEITTTTEADDEEETEKPTKAPSIKPTVKPTEAPTPKPTVAPTEEPTTKPTVAPTTKPTVAPTVAPTTKPTVAPTVAPTTAPATGNKTPWQPGNNSYTYSELQSCSNITSTDIANARAILSSIIYTEMSDLDKIKTVHDYLVMNTTYEYGYYNRADSHDHLKNILVNKIAVCQGYSVAFYVFMKELGIPCTLMLGDADNGSSSVGHAWNAVKIDGNWYFVDVTWDDPFVNGSTSYIDGYNLSYEYLLCTFDHIGVSHTYDDYIGEQPVPYGASSQYNDYMYKTLGYDGLYRISSLDKVVEVAKAVTGSCTYMFIIEAGAITTTDVWNTFCDNLDVNKIGGYSVGGSMSDATVEVTVTKS